MAFFKNSEIRRAKVSRNRRHYCRYVRTCSHWTATAFIFIMVTITSTLMCLQKTVVPDVPLHLTYPVDCAGVLEGRTKDLEVAGVLLTEVKKMTTHGSIPMPTDNDVATYASDCAFFKAQRGYPLRARSRKEREYPLAFVIVAHRNAAQLEMLLRALYEPQNVYAIHPDAKASPEFIDAVKKMASCFENVFVCSRLEEVEYGRHSRLMADINCMQDLLEHRVRWKYVINQCGEAFPLKTNLEMVRQLESYHGLNDVESYPVSDKKRRRFLRYSHDRKLTIDQRLQEDPPPGNIALFSGNAYNSLTREFVEYVLKEELPKRFLNWLSDSWSPDEHYWATLNRVPGVPGGMDSSSMDLTTYVNWKQHHRHTCHGSYIHSVCVFSFADLQLVSLMPHLFVNKFHYADDPITLQCLQQSITNRTRKESTSIL